MNAFVANVGNDNFPRTVLVIEDEVLIRWIVAEYLRGCGYRVVEAGSGDEAIQLLGTAITANVVLSDVRMPGSTDGLALAHWVRRQRPNTNVILTSGLPTAMDAARALCVDAPLVSKPYSVADLEQQIRKLLAA